MDYIIGESDLYLTYDEEPDVQELLKAGKVHIEDKNSTLLEVIVEYIKVSNSLLKQNAVSRTLQSHMSLTANMKPYIAI